MIAGHPDVAARLRAAYDRWWSDVLPRLENEDVTGPRSNPFKDRYWSQFGGGPDPALRDRMDPGQSGARREAGKPPSRDDLRSGGNPWRCRRDRIESAQRPPNLVPFPRISDAAPPAPRPPSSPLGLLAALLAAPAARAFDDPKAPEGFVPIFDGKSLNGWHGMPHFSPYDLAKLKEEEREKKVAEWTEDARKHWTTENGELVNDGHGAYLTSDKEYGDIELLIDYKTVAKADSGIYLRTTPQVQIWDSTEAGGKKGLGMADKGSGGLWNNSPGSSRARTRWSSPTCPSASGIASESASSEPGPRSTSTTSCVVDHAIMENFWDRSKPLPPRGFIQLQTHGGEIRWKDIYVREIPAAEANTVLASKNSEGFKPIFDGKTLRDWAGAVDHYEVVDAQPPLQETEPGSVLSTSTRSTATSPHASSSSSPRRQQWPGDPLPRQGRLYRLPGDVRAPVCSTTPTPKYAGPSRPEAGPRVDLRPGGRRIAATSARSASGTSRR